MTRAGSSSRTEFLARDSESANPPPEQLLQIALVHHRKGDHEREVEDYKRLIAARPGNFAYLNNLAWTSRKTSNVPRKASSGSTKRFKKGGRFPNCSTLAA